MSVPPLQYTRARTYVFLSPDYETATADALSACASGTSDSGGDARSVLQGTSARVQLELAAPERKVITSRPFRRVCHTAQNLGTSPRRGSDPRYVTATTEQWLTPEFRFSRCFSCPQLAPGTGSVCARRARTSILYEQWLTTSPNQIKSPAPAPPSPNSFHGFGSAVAFSALSWHLAVCAR